MQLGQSTLWTEGKNRQAVNLVMDADGLVGKDGFVSSFNERMPSAKRDFEAVIKEFKDVAFHLKDIIIKNAVKSANSTSGASQQSDQNLDSKSNLSPNPNSKSKVDSYRATELQGVFEAFDFDDSGKISKDEIMAIGLAR